MKKPKPLDKYTRAVRYAKRTFNLELFVGAGESTWLPEKLQEFIRGQVALAWVTGFDAARRGLRDLPAPGEGLARRLADSVERHGKQTTQAALSEMVQRATEEKV